MYDYRVFVAYSHEDRPLAEQVVRLLEQIGLRPMWDADLIPGASFTEQIKNGIAYAHAFLPILTKSSSRRPWVHQELGYAMGLNVPLLPLAVGTVPTGMPGQLQAVQVSTDLSDLRQLLTAGVVEYVVSHGQLDSHPRFCCADLPEKRAAMLVDYAQRVIDLGSYGRVRQSGALTSFCLPDKDVQHRAWAEREGRMPRSDSYRKLLREERNVLERHAKEAGSDLMIDLSPSYEAQGPGAKAARLGTLIEFLESMPDDKVRVVFKSSPEPHNLLIVGDWFIAESMAPRPSVGYLQTMFTTHAPTVLNRLKQFDEKFEELREEAGTDAGSSRVSAIARIREELRR